MRVVQLVAPDGQADLAADRLWQAGATAVEELPAGDGRVALRSVLAADDDVTRARLGVMPDDWHLEWVEVPDNPSEAWREAVEPIDVDGRLVLRPAWLPSIDDDRLEIAIEPGASFGLGDHPTTRLSASAAARLSFPGCRVLDVGCGSGVLGIVAARLGAAGVVAIDISEAAIEATRENALRNGVEHLVAASSTPLADLDGEFDLVLANVLAPTLVEMAPDLRRVLAAGGRLVISGVLAERHDHVVAALAPLRAVRTDVLDAWAAVELAD